jgi:hypothetical protein
VLRETARVLGRLNADQRLAVIGVAVIAASLPLPWWRAPADRSLVVTGIGDFGFVEGALVLTAVMALLLVLRVGAGQVPPRPLQEWGLLVVAGVWAAVIVGYRMFDRPEFTLGDSNEPYDLGYGIMLALGGAALIAVAGLRLRKPERSSKART